MLFITKRFVQPKTAIQPTNKPTNSRPRARRTPDGWFLCWWLRLLCGAPFVSFLSCWGYFGCSKPETHKTNNPQTTKQTNQKKREPTHQQTNQLPPARPPPRSRWLASLLVFNSQSMEGPFGVLFGLLRGCWGITWGLLWITEGDY